ncbi:MAG TPA: hypothetical protein VJU59_36520 [Paraburkholderia sp.]|uniref:hypothetical protein n=1 Tax=Paraburkholderia sp. TaxID=1926495 RepID=UPI002B474306|nr:hypothetical protein [Paraburkholderia sp.]HKR45115.1 hypothetical protein [Paraburkholderia sp.]
MVEEMFFDAVIEKALLGFLTKADCDRADAFYCPKADMDVNLHAAAQRYFWSFAFLG